MNAPNASPRPVGRDSVEPSNERSEASVASISGGITPSQDARFARASCVGKWGSTESHPTGLADVGVRAPEPWLLLNSGPCAPAFNMAMDEALLEAAASLGQPVLRFYSWTEPAATFGYFQRYAEIERATHLRPLIRRPTGGGLVPHDADWTYSVVIPPSHPWHALNAVDSYRRMHEWIRAAFARLGVATELADCCRKSAPGQCFVGWEKFDVLWQGLKIAGAAQRRNKLGLLIQGSVQPPPVALVRGDWERAMSPANHSELVLSAEIHARAEALATEKYSQPAFNARR